jgi:hypothetical protein
MINGDEAIVSATSIKVVEPKAIRLAGEKHRQRRGLKLQ